MPKGLVALARNGESRPLHPLWQRRMSTKFNGVSYPIQRAAEAVYSEAGKAQVAGLISHYMENARILREACASIGLDVFGGVNAPYIWVSTPPGIGSWDMFDLMLEDANIVITPGSGFGAHGEGFFRVSAFNSRANAQEAARRIVGMNF
jgi:LL-diaminopimelate aminotransferase